MTTDYRRDFDRYDDRSLTPQELARIWRATPQELRHGLMNMVYRADEQLHNQVVALTAKQADAGVGRSVSEC